jgi:AhpD family alkylhydroperoxidase
VAVTLRCDGCITVHTEAAIKHGATKEEIAEALGVATSVNAGAALVYSARVMDAFREYPRAASPNEPDSLANLRG